MIRLLTIALCMLLARAADARPLVVGSKAFTESVVLGEVYAALARSRGLEVTHRRELGGTRVVFAALERGDLDVYPDYTGTLLEEIFAGQNATAAQLPELLAQRGLVMSAPLGFDNRYALGMKRARAAALGLRTTSDLAHADVTYAFSNEFLERRDGWPGLRARYGLTPTQVRGVHHDLAYRAIASGDVDVTDLYTTDPEIVADDLVVLADDLHYFPAYQAVFLARADRDVDLTGLAGALDENVMSRLNAEVKLGGKTEAEVASAFVTTRFGVHSVAALDTRAGRIVQRTLEHLALCGVALAFAITMGLGLGILASKRARFGRFVLGISAVLQTLPSLALLVVLLPLLGLGDRPAVVALVLYALLPIVRGTHAGLQQIPRGLAEAAVVLGLSPAYRLWKIELPLALPTMLAGLQVASITTVGTATLGALVGAGGYGQPILTGIRLDRTDLILEGAIPAAVLAVLVLATFELLERLLVPRRATR